MWKTVAIPWKQLLSDKDVSREFKRIPLRQIRKNPNQPRKLFDVQALQELADSVRQVGIITPSPSGGWRRGTSSSPESGGCGPPSWPG